MTLDPSTLLGIKMTRPASMTREEAQALVQRADALGYHSIWVGELWAADPFVTLTELALKTSRIRLGTSIVNVFSRTPSAIAQAIATLDVASKGRAILGLGTSGKRVVEEWHGVPFAQPVQRTREYIEIIRRMLAGEPVDYQGRLFRLRRFTLELRPVQQRLPIYVAALGPRNLRLTGELADGWLPAYVNPGMESQLGHLRASARAAGREPASIVVAPETYVCVTEDVAQARALVRAATARSICGDGSFYADQVRRAGFPDAVEQALALWRAGRREAAAQAIPDAAVEAFAIAGSAGHCREGLEALRAKGWTLPIIRFPRGAPRQMIADTIEGVAPKAR